MSESIDHPRPSALTLEQRLSVYARLVRLLNPKDEACNLAPMEGIVLRTMRFLEPELVAADEARRAVVEVEVPATRIAELRAELEVLEWTQVDGAHHCPRCYNAQRTGHAPNCPLAKALGRKAERP